jgi:hypothetical protein
MKKRQEAVQESLFGEVIRGTEIAPDQWEQKAVGYHPSWQSGAFDTGKDGDSIDRWYDSLRASFPDTDVDFHVSESMETTLDKLPKRRDPATEPDPAPARPAQKETLFYPSTGLPTFAHGLRGGGRVRDVGKDEYMVSDKYITTSSGRYSRDLEEYNGVDELTHYQNIIKQEGWGSLHDSEEQYKQSDVARPHLQGLLFDRHVASQSSMDPSETHRSQRWEAANRIASGKGGLNAEVPNPKVHAQVANHLYDSSVPFADLQKAVKTGTSTGTFKAAPEKSSAHYNPRNHAIRFDDESLPSQNTVVHELGHALHIGGDEKARSKHARFNVDKRPDAVPSAVLEGVADGYTDLYSNDTSIQPLSSTMRGRGYHDTFNLPEQHTNELGKRIDISSISGGMYAAMREQVRTTGEIPHISEFSKVSDFRHVQGDQFASLRRSAEADLNRRQGVEQLELFPRREPLP